MHKQVSRCLCILFALRSRVFPRPNARPGAFSFSAAARLPRRRLFSLPPERSLPRRGRPRRASRLAKCTVESVFACVFRLCLRHVFVLFPRKHALGLYLFRAKADRDRTRRAAQENRRRGGLTHEADHEGVDGRLFHLRRVSLSRPMRRVRQNMAQHSRPFL